MLKKMLKHLVSGGAIYLFTRFLSVFYLYYLRGDSTSAISGKVKMVKTIDLIGFEEVRRTLRHHRDSSKRQPSFYRVDSSGAYNYFDCNPDYREQILNYFRKLRGEGVPIVHLDICGVATVQSLGGNKSYCFSLKDSSGIDWRGNQTVQGDLFSGRDFNRFLREVKSQPVAPALITFRPIVGLQDNNPSLNGQKYRGFREVTEGILGKRFGQCVEVLGRWGYMYLETPFQGECFADFMAGTSQEEWRLSLQIKELAKIYHCNIQIEGSIFGPKFLLRKRRN